MKKLSLKWNFVFNFIGQVLSLIIPVITAPYLARIFHEAGNGQISFANNIITYFTMLANLGFTIYGQREVAKEQSNIDERSVVFWEVFFSRLIFSAASIIILFVLNYFSIFGAAYREMIYILSIQVLACIFDASFYFQGIEDFRDIALRSIFVKLATLICVFIFVKTEDDIGKYLLIYSASILLGNLIMLPMLRKQIHFVPFSNLHVFKKIWPSLIVFLPSLVTTVYGSLDKLMIGYLATEGPDYQNGVYGQALKINQLILVLITVIDSIMIARNAFDYANGNRRNMKNHIYMALDYVFHVGFPLIVGMAFLADNLSSWFLGSGYKEVPLLLCIMSVRFIASGVGSVLGNELFIVVGKEKIPLVAHICTLLVNLATNFIFIPRYGAVGAAITTAIAEVIDCIVILIFAFYYKYISATKYLLLQIRPIIATAILGIYLLLVRNLLSYSIGSFLLWTVTGSLLYGFSLFLLQDPLFKFAWSKFIDIPVKRLLHKIIPNGNLSLNYLDSSDSAKEYRFSKIDPENSTRKSCN